MSSSLTSNNEPALLEQQPQYTILAIPSFYYIIYFDFVHIDNDNTLIE